MRFGQAVEYLVEPKRKDEEPSLKFAPKARTAVFFGYKFAPGGAWKGEYIVLDWKKTCSAVTVRGAAVYRVKEVNPLEKLVHPFKNGDLLWLCLADGWTKWRASMEAKVPKPSRKKT